MTTETPKQTGLPVRGYAGNEYRVPKEPTPPGEGQSALYLTFGVQYAREPHPYLPAAHPDGFLTVIYGDPERTPHTANRERARRTAWEWLQAHYAFDYDSIEAIGPEYVPWGELACMVLP